MSNKALKFHRTAFFCIALLPAVGATAQELLLEEVVVTAQKRAESLSDVPISVNVMSGEKIAQAGITNLDDLSDFVPNLTLNQTGLTTNIAIRGISSGINPAFEQSVGMYIDDVYYGRAQLARVPYLDPDRVEILRGPQPILFGKNAIAGAISMATKRPSLEGVAGYVQAEYNFDQEVKDVQFGINVPLGETFAARIAGLYRDSEGYYENTTLNRDESANEEYVIRGSFLFEPTDELSLSLKLETGEFDTEGRFLEIINPAQLPGAPVSYADVLRALTGGAYNLETEQDFERQSNGDLEENEFQNATFTVDYALGEHTLTAITGYVDYETFLQCDCDFTGAVVFDAPGSEEFEQFSQELRLTSPGGETIDYIVGAFYQTYEVVLDDLTNVPTNSILGLVSPLTVSLPGTGAQRAYETDSDLWSIFAQFTLNVSDVLRVTVGARYTTEDKSGSRVINIVDVNQPSPVRDITGLTPTTGGSPGLYGALFAIDSEQLNVSGNVGCGGASDAVGHNLDCDRDEAKLTPAINVQWDVNDDIMAYASLSTGFKAGGFDARANNTGSFEFEEEEALSFELGAKMALAGGAAELNVALYRTEYTDLQTSQFDGTLAFNVTNAGEATTQGAELDGRWQASENLLLTGSFAWLDFEWDEFPNSECYFNEDTPFVNTRNGGPSDYPAGDPLNGLCDRAGERREFTPEITANLGGQYFVPLGDSMELVLGLDLAYSDDYSVSPSLDPNLEQDAYYKLNGRVALGSQEGTWELALLLENITDEEILTFGNRAPVSTTLTQGGATAYYAFYEAPFNTTLHFRYNF